MFSGGRWKLGDASDGYGIIIPITRIGNILLTSTSSNQLRCPASDISSKQRTWPENPRSICSRRIRYLQGLNLLQGNEWDAMTEGERHSTAGYWIELEANEWAGEEEILSQHAFEQIWEACVDCRNTIQYNTCSAMHTRSVYLIKPFIVLVTAQL